MPFVMAVLTVALSGCGVAVQRPLAIPYSTVAPVIDPAFRWSRTEAMDSVFESIGVPSLRRVTLPEGTTEIRIEAGYGGWIGESRILRLVERPGEVVGQFFAMDPATHRVYLPVFAERPDWAQILAVLDSSGLRTMRDSLPLVSIVDAEELTVEVLIGSDLRSYHFNAMRGRLGVPAGAERVFETVLGLRRLFAACIYPGFPPGATQWVLYQRENKETNSGRPECKEF